MDPLSITASAVTLIGVAATITTSVNGFIQSLRTADSRISDLCSELASLQDFLSSVDRSLRGRHAIDLALIDEDLWRQCESALMDCQVTLNSLNILVEKIRATAKVKGLGWRVKAIKDLNDHGAEITTYRDKIHKSNWALQTMLHAITVSLSLRNKESQDTIILKLDILERSINKALDASLASVGPFSAGHGDLSDARVAKNLRKLAKAAGRFHSAASSTTSTIRDDSTVASYALPSHYDATAASILGDLPAFKRERVEAYLRQDRFESPHRSASPDILPRLTSPRRRSFSPARRSRRMSTIDTNSGLPPAPVPDMSTAVVEEDSEDDESEFERGKLEGLGELARLMIKQCDFDKAEKFLKEAVRREAKLRIGSDKLRSLQTQLALCHFLKGEWLLAEPLVKMLAEQRHKQDIIVLNLLHALALAHLSTYAFTEALAFCKQAYYGKKRQSKKGVQGAEADCHQTVGLLALIYDMSGEFIDAEVCRQQVPSGFVYTHPKGEHEFIVTHPHLLDTAFGEDSPRLELLQTMVQASAAVELDAGPFPSQQPTEDEMAMKRSKTISGSPLRTRFENHLKYECDTGKEVVVSSGTSLHSGLTGPTLVVDIDADDEASPISSSPIKRRLTRMYRKIRKADDIPSPRIPASSPIDASPPAVSPGAEGGWLRKSKTLLRKKLRRDGIETTFDSDHQPQSFRLLKMQKYVWSDDEVDTVKESDCTPAIMPGTVPQLSVLRARTAAMTHVLDGDNNAVLESGFKHSGNPCERNNLEPETRSNLAELESAPMSRFGEISSQNEIGLNQEVQPIPITAETYWQRAFCARSASSRDEPEWSHVTDQDAWELVTAAQLLVDTLKPQLDMSKKGNGGTTAGTNAEVDEQITRPLDKRPSMKLQIVEGGNQASICRRDVITTLSENHTDLIASLATTMAALSSHKSDIDRLMAKAKLLRLHKDLSNISGDSTLLGDMERVIVSLSLQTAVATKKLPKQMKKREAADSSADDSGYESMPVIEESDSEATETELESTRSQRLAISPKPALRRAFSFELGDVKSEPTVDGMAAPGETIESVDRLRPPQNGQHEEEEEERDGRAATVESKADDVALVVVSPSRAKVASRMCRDTDTVRQDEGSLSKDLDLYTRVLGSGVQIGVAY